MLSFPKTQGQAKGSGAAVAHEPISSLLSPWQAIFSSPVLLLLPSVKLRMSNVILNEQCESEKKMPVRYLINETWNLHGKPKMLSRHCRGDKHNPNKLSPEYHSSDTSRLLCKEKHGFLRGCKNSWKRDVME